MKIRTSISKEFLSLEELIKLHNTSLDVCPADSGFNTLTFNPKTKTHSRRKIELNKDDLLQYFNKQGYATYAVALNREQQPVPHLMPYNSHEANDFANLLKSQLTKFIKKQYPQATGIVLHLDEAVPNAHIFFYDYDATDDPTHAYQPHSNYQKPKATNNEQQDQLTKNNQRQKQLHQEQQQRLRQRQVQIAIKIAEDKKKKLEKQRQMRLRRRRYRQNDGPDL